MRRLRQGRRLGALPLAAGMGLLLAIISSGAIRTSAQEQDGAGLVVSGKATPQDVGLPQYPGAKPHKDNKDDSDSARLGLWGGGYGFKVVVVKMESNDPPRSVAEFYRKALAKYGPVLDCTNGGAASSAKDSSSDSLKCDEEKSDKDGMLFKAGTQRKQRIVAVQPNGKGSLFQLIYVWYAGD